MTSSIDIYQTANELIKQHGEDAPIHAASRYWHQPQLSRASILGVD